MKLTLKRNPTTRDWMFGNLFVEGEWECHTLEDELRENKVYAETAIPAGTYQITLIDSPKFGKDSLWLRNVPKFEGILIHGGVTDEHSAGCILVGDRVEEAAGRILGGTPKSGAQDEGALAKLKVKVIEAIRERGEEVWIEIQNAAGDQFVDTGSAAA